MSKNWKQRWQRRFGYGAWALIGLGLVAVLVWVVVTRLDFDNPTVSLKEPVEVVGAKTTLAAEAADQGSGIKEVKISFSQGGVEKVVADQKFPPGGAKGETVQVPFTLEPKALGFQEGKATLTVQVRDRSWRNFFAGRQGEISREVVIDLIPVNLGFQSVSYLMHSGGTGVISYHLNKPVKESGVVTEKKFFQGYPNPRGGQGNYVVLFPVPQEAPGSFQVELVAKPALGSEVKQTISLKCKPRRWRHDSLNLPDNFLRKVASSFPVTNPNDLLGSYLQVNRELRRQNHEKFKQVCSHSEPKPLWTGAFQRYIGKPMARFGDRRTYLYEKKPVDQQVHLGEDLASLINSPVPVANSGVVVLAEPLGIYGNTVIIDHGLGVFTSYSHLSKIEVKTGDRVAKGTVVGHTGTTGLAAGDHLHFAVNLQGEFVDPLEWWDAHWLKDQVEKVWTASAPPAATPAAETTPKKAKSRKRR